MKRYLIFLLSFFYSGLVICSSIDSTGLPGDNFSLEGAMDIFKTSRSPEDFEKNINDPEKSINNLDLNHDGKVDYIRVEDYTKDNVHALVLKVDINENETQDIAVIEIEKTGDNEAVAQILGDSILYGDTPIIEPTGIVNSQGEGSGPNGDIKTHIIVVNVWLWPSVRYIYRPRYRPWISPWRWSLYPVWWRPWRPHPWRVFYPRVRVYRVHYRRAPFHRVVHAHRIYRPKRRTSATIVKRTTIIRTNRRHGVVAQKTKTTRVGVHRENGKISVGKQTKTTRGVKIKGKGQVSHTKTSSTKVTLGKNGKMGKTKVTKHTTKMTKRNKRGGRTTVTKTKVKKRKNRK